MKKIKTPKFFSRAKKSISNGLDRVLAVIPVRYLVGGTAVVLFVVLYTSCKKETHCPEGYNYDIQKNPPKSAMAAKSSDECEFERNERDTAEYRLNYVYAPNVRNAVEPALYEPDTIASFYWNLFPGWKDIPFKDSVYLHTLTCQRILDDYPGHNEFTLKALQEFCKTWTKGLEDLQEKQSALDECESVGIIEYEWVKDECGGYWRAKGALASKSTMTGNATSAWESTNTGTNVKTQYTNNRQK